MSVSKITSPVTPLEEVAKINEIIDNLGGSSGVNADLCNLTATGEAHFVKPSELATCHVVIETWHSGTEWYRVYDDGWCEQGGGFGAAYSSYTTKTILFEKEFVDTNYNVQITSASSGNLYTPTISALTTASFTAANTYNLNGNSRWMACGYIS